MNAFALLNLDVGLPATVALAAVAVIGYVFGRRSRSAKPPGSSDEQVARAAEIARQLEAIAASLRNDLATHRAEVERFKLAVQDSPSASDDASHRALRDEADRVLEPTLRLVTQVAGAYDQIRKQTHALSRFSGGRTDSLTGLCNSRALGELLQIELSGCAATGGQVSIAILGLHTPKGLGDKPLSDQGRSQQQARVLQATELLRAHLRDSDVLARYGVDELVVVMPHTRLYGASVFGRRVRTVLGDAGLDVSCGLAQAAPKDTSASLLARADSALYSAKAKGVGAQFLHNGHSIREDAPNDSPSISETLEAPPAEAAPLDANAAAPAETAELSPVAS